MIRGLILTLSPESNEPRVPTGGSFHTTHARALVLRWARYPHHPPFLPDAAFFVSPAYFSFAVCPVCSVHPMLTTAKAALLLHCVISIIFIRTCRLGWSWVRSALFSSCPLVFGACVAWRVVLRAARWGRGAEHVAYLSRSYPNAARGAC